MENKKRIIALGFFDGVHLGHGALLRRVKELADLENAIPAAVTFDHHPKNVIPGGEHVLLLNTPEDREEMMRRLYGIQEIIVLPFDSHMMDMNWKIFVTDLLIKEYGAGHFVAGHDFHFGSQNEGDPEKLSMISREYGIGCDIIKKIELNGIRISSNYIRSLIQSGDMEKAREFLGHPHTLSGTVVHGQQLGRTLGIPTSNLIFPDGLMVPDFGVYATKVWIEDREYSAVTNVGVRPTVCDYGQATIESWILNFHEDIYGQHIRVEFYKKLRKEKKFQSIDELKLEIQKNAETAAAYFQSASY